MKNTKRQSILKPMTRDSTLAKKIEFAALGAFQTGSGTPRKRIGTGMLGYAFMGKAHTNAFLRFPLFFPDSPIPRLVAIAGRSESNVKDAATNFGYERFYTNWLKLVKDPDIQVVDNGLPNDLHEKPCVTAAELGKDIVCEKPLGRNPRESEEMLRAVTKAGVKHMVGFNYRFIPAIRLARQLIEEGYIGKVLEFRAAYLQDWIMDPNFPLVWRLRKSLAGSGVLGDLGTHILDLGRFLVGEIESTIGLTKTFIKERPLPPSDVTGEKKRGKVDVDDVFIALLKFKSGAIGSAEASRFCAGRKNYQRIEVHGSEGSLSFNLERLNELDAYVNSDGEDRRGFKTISVTAPVHPFGKNWWPTGHVLGWEHPMVHEMYHFFTAVAEDRPIEPWGATFRDGLMADRITDAISKSTMSGKWESIISTP
ncbi:MAG: Gfo/Idh/MocA family oxidoreductase [Thaumarchaeota archaeon]|nr:Gfo/Idh/MocA family oxidoreductase [Nitrososphaerota archaeon]